MGELGSLRKCPPESGCPPSPTQLDHSSPSSVRPSAGTIKGVTPSWLFLRAEGFGEKKSSATPQQHCPDLQIHGGTLEWGQVQVLAKKHTFGRMSWKMGLQACPQETASPAIARETPLRVSCWSREAHDDFPTPA